MKELLNSIDVPMAIAGLGLFLFAMLQLEQALEGLLGGTFKRLLRRYTQHPAAAMSTGVFSTAILQSSSLVGVMSLALVGSGVIALSSGIGIILGANLGTTMTGWVVSVIGFKLDLADAALPLLALGSVGFIALRAWPYLAGIMRLVLAVALLIWALSLMKAAIQSDGAELSAAISQGQGWISFFFIGLILTLIVQSSSAMMMITLSLLSASLLDIHHAAAVVVGADLGTTGTVMLGAIGGTAPRRQVAYAHLWFNVLNAIIALLLIPLIPAAMALTGLSDPLFALVAFHSSFNLIGILLFYPFLSYYSEFLQRRVQDKVIARTLYLNPEVGRVPEAGIEALHNESQRVVALGIGLIRRDFHVAMSIPESMVGQVQDYMALKQLEFDIITFAAKLETCVINVRDAQCLQSDLNAVRNTVHAVKCVQDIGHNLQALYVTEDEQLHQLWLEIQSSYTRAMEPLRELLMKGKGKPVNFPVAKAIADAGLKFEALHESFHQKIFQLYPKIDPFLAKESELIREPALQLPSLLNMNRELYVGQRSLMQAVEALGEASVEPEHSGSGS